MKQSNNQLDYLPGLDGIRALAAFLVILAHWPNYLLSLKFAWMGVNIFFVLSGFLITRILVVEKVKPFKSYISCFYYKRLLRIFPLYYGYLLLAFLVIITITSYNTQLLKYGQLADARNAIKHDYGYYLTYTYNFKISLAFFTHVTAVVSRFFSHLWSLSVEEQFYVIFPLIVYFTSAKTLKIVTISMLVFCPLLRLWGILYGVNLVSDHYWFGEVFYSNTLCQCDALFMGVALAIFDIRPAKRYVTFFITLSVWLLTGLTCLYFLRKSGYFLASGKSLGYDFPAFWFSEKTQYWFINIRPVYQYTLVNLLAASLILPASKKQGLFPWFFQSKAMRYFGRISYGVYVFHFPLIAVFMITADAYFGGWAHLTLQPMMEIMCFVLYFVVLILVAHISYQYFEKRILKYKNKLSVSPVHATI